jgi:hypothetical protein
MMPSQIDRRREVNQTVHLSKDTPQGATENQTGCFYQEMLRQVLWLVKHRRAALRVKNS